MANKSDKRYEIDVLLSMARITTNESKRTEYLNRVELLLDGSFEETELKSYEMNPYGDEKVRTAIEGFVKNCGGVNNLVGELTETVFNNFTEYCIEENGLQLNKMQFGKYFHNITTLKSKLIHRRNKYYRIYVFDE